MKRFDSPLDHLKIASPCRSDWNEMLGDDRKRYCSECKLNVYNLSDMSRSEAESLLINSEGRLCVRYYRRADGTVLTKDCPVGWRALKTKTVRIVTSFASLIVGILAGVFAVRTTETMISILPMGEVTAVKVDNDPAFDGQVPIAGQIEFVEEVWSKPALGTLTKVYESKPLPDVGRVEKIRPLSKEKVVVWIK